MTQRRTAVSGLLGVSVLAWLVASCGPDLPSRPVLESKFAGLPADSTGTPIAVNRFAVVSRLEGDVLTVSLDTDLPDFAGLMVSVRRSYFEKGRDQELSLDYFNESSTVGAWREPRQIKVSHSLFQSRLDEKQREMASVGLGAPVDRVGDELSASFTFHLRQNNKAFGEENRNVVGRAAVQLGPGKVARAETQIRYPWRTAGGPSANWVGASALIVGRTYELPAETPLMPTLSPEGLDETVEAIADRRMIPAGGLVTVKAQGNRGGSRWYRVSATDQTGRAVGDGWINSDVLIGKALRQR